VLGVDAVPADALEVNPNLGAFVEEFDGVRVATTAADIAVLAVSSSAAHRH